MPGQHPLDGHPTRRQPDRRRTALAHIPTAPADIYSSTNNAPNIVLQPMPSGPWEITTKVTGPFYTAYQQAGLVVYGDDDNYAKLVFSGRSSSGDKAARIIQFSHEQGGGAAQEANTQNLGAAFPDTVWLKLTSDGENLTPSYSTDGITWIAADDSWTGWSTVRKSTAAFTNPRVGLLSLANSGTAVDAAFDFFHLTPDNTAGGSREVGPVRRRRPGLQPVERHPTGRRARGVRRQLTIPIEAKDLYQTTNNAGNLVLQAMPEGAWEVTTKVTGAMYTSYEQAGIVVYGDDDNYAKLVFEGRSSSGDKAARIIQFSHEQAGAAQEANSANLGADFPDTVWLKLSSDGTNLTPSYSVDGETWISAPDTASWSGWSTMRKSTAGFTNPQVGSGGHGRSRGGSGGRRALRLLQRDARCRRGDRSGRRVRREHAVRLPVDRAASGRDFDGGRREPQASRDGH